MRADGQRVSLFAPILKRRVAPMVALFAGTLSVAAHGAEFDREAFFERSWFAVEVIVFGYPRPNDAKPPFLAIERERLGFTIPRSARALMPDDEALAALQNRVDNNAAALDGRVDDPSIPRSLFEPHRGIGSHDGYGNIQFPGWLWHEEPFWAWRAPKHEAAGIDLDQPGYQGRLPPLPSLDPIEPPPPSDLELLTKAAARFEASLTQIRLKPERVDRLRRAERNIARRFRVFFYGRWLQDVPPRGEPEPVLVDATVNGERLFGQLSFTLARYLHLDAHLVRRYDDEQVSVLEEHRRLRSREVHYLDHPAIGIVVRIDRLDVPQVLEDLAFRLNQGTE